MDIPADMVPLKEAIDDITKHELIVLKLMDADENDQAHELMERLFLRLLSHLHAPKPFDRTGYVNATIAAGLKKPERQRIDFAAAAYHERTRSLYASGVQTAATAALLIVAICDCRGLPKMGEAWFRIANEYHPSLARVLAAE